jgi:hypothetical protein
VTKDRGAFYYAILIYLVAGLLALFVYRVANADVKTARAVRCDESKMVAIYVRPHFSTIINFPIKPDNVVLGGQGLFAIGYIKSDLAVTSLGPSSKTNLFAYLTGRRCGFLLITSTDRHDSLVKVQDPEESKLQVKFK